MKKTIDMMSEYEIARWFALMEAVDIINENCKTTNKEFDELHLNPIAIKQFINNTAIKIESDLSKKDYDLNKPIIKALIGKIESELVEVD